MKKWLLTIIMSTGIFNGIAQKKPPWTNPDVFSINRDPAHAFSLVFPDEQSARPEPDWENPFAKSSRYQVLNGTWKFKWTENIASVPKDFFKADYNVSGWDDIPVPLPWQMAGNGQLYYFNSQMPMLNDRRNLSDPAEASEGKKKGQMDLMNPKNASTARQIEAAKRAYIPERWNPVGSYVTEFTLPTNWKGLRTVLHFSGVKSGFTCWVNGREVGYSQGSYTPAEFDISEYLNPGKNQLAVQVIRWTDGSYLENQDRIRMSGIFRDVYLFATPKAHIGNFYVHPEVKKSLNRVDFSVNVELRNSGKTEAKNRSTEVDLVTPDGKTLLTLKKNFSFVPSGKSEIINLKSELKNPRLWHTEDPQLYTVLIKLLDNGKVTEVIRQDVGFRRFDWDELGNIYLNGKRYYMRGVNRSDCSPETGYYVDYADMLKDALTMKQLNIDNVRTSHNPNDIRWYALCNRLGITVLDEANLETHWHESIFSNPETEKPWRVQAVSRMRNMVERDKNQPCIVMWSIGNEQFERQHGLPTVRAMYDVAKSIDQSRGVFCERMFDDKENVCHEPDFDAIGPMYRGKEQYVKWHQNGQDRRPFFMSEYAHAMGNSDIELKKQWEFFEKYDGLNGGQIWDWRDQAVWYPLPGLDGKHLTYGGDWGAFGSDSTFCMNGVVLPDRGFTGKSYETKGTYQQVEFMPSDDPGKVRVKNKFGTKNLNEFNIEIVLLKDGVSINRRELSLELAPLSETELTIPFERDSFQPAADYHLNYDVRWKENTPWADAGFVLARGQVELQKGKGSTELLPLYGTLSVSESGGKIVINAGKTVVEFDTGKALLSQLICDDKKILAPDDTLQGVEANFNIHPIDDNVLWPVDRIRSFFKEQRNILKREAISTKITAQSSDRVSVETENKYLFPKRNCGYLHKATYTVLPSGVIQVDNYVKKIGLTKKDFLLRIGVRIPIAKSFDQASYLAYGPNENYVSRRAWERYGVHHHNAGKFFSQYVRPQECGNRSALEWIALQNLTGVGLEVVGEKPANGSVMPWTVEQFDKAKHIPELGESTRWILRYDSEFPGINKWAAFFFEGDYVFSYSIRLLNKGTDPAKAAISMVPDSVKTEYKLFGEKKEEEVLPERWQRISNGASAEYSSRSRWASYPDSLLTTQKSPFAFHTEAEKAPWVIIDLKKTFPVCGLKILNRDDTQGNRTKNLHVWVSKDKTNWKQVFKTTGAEDKWLVKINPVEPVRFIKIGMLVTQPEFFHLKGVSVYTKDK